MTADEFIRDELQIPKYVGITEYCTDGDIINAMIGFAQFHTEAALRRATEKLTMGGIYGSILRAYPSENIK